MLWKGRRRPGVQYIKQIWIPRYLGESSFETPKIELEVKKSETKKVNAKREKSEIKNQKKQKNKINFEKLSQMKIGLACQCN